MLHMVRPGAEVCINGLVDCGAYSIILLPAVKAVISPDATNMIYKVVCDGSVSDHCVPLHLPGEPLGERFLQGVLELCLRAAPELHAVGASQSVPPGTRTLVRTSVHSGQAVSFYHLERTVDSSVPLPKVDRVVHVLSVAAPTDMEENEMLLAPTTAALEGLQLTSTETVETKVMRAPPDLQAADRGLFTALHIARVASGSGDDLAEGAVQRMDTYGALLHAMLYTVGGPGGGPSSAVP